MDKKTKVLVIIICLGLLSLVGMGAFYFGKQQQPTVSPSPLASVSPESSVEPSLVPRSSPSPSLVPAVIVDETELIKQAVYRFTHLNEAMAEVTINRRVANHATGNIKEYEAVGGAYWLAAKTTSGWVAVYAGQAQPECAKIEGYDFPKDMVPECLNSAGKVVKR